MSLMVLQTILFPDAEICKEKAMYFHEEEGILSLDTYFNAFSIGKWRKYTELEDLSLVLRMKADAGAGKSMLSGRGISAAQIAADGRRTDVPIRLKISGEETLSVEVSFPDLPEDGILAVFIQGGKAEQIISGFWGTSMAPVNSVRLAMGICTFRREEFLERNLGRLQRYLADHPESPLCGHLEVFISDNGRTLDAGKWNTDIIHMFPNKNAGGSGGFTRTMMEALLRGRRDYTHIILTDDDIVLSPYVLERTYRFLQYLKAEYRCCMVGGALLDLDRRYLQMEQGARDNGVHQTLFKRSADLREALTVAANETEEDVNYCAWIYACIPAETVRPDNLPMPLFLHDDDIEYGIRNTQSERNGCRILFLNGICAWHPNTVTKAAGWAMYYDVRNVLIGINSTSYAASWKEFREYASYVLYTRLFHYEYESAERVVMGIQDYLKGPEAFLQLDVEANHQRVMYREQTIPPEKAGVADLQQRNRLSEEMDRNELSMNKVAEYLGEACCLLLPASRKTVKVVRDKGVWEPFTAGRVYAYDEGKGTGVLRTRDRSRMVRIMREFNRVMRMLHAEYDDLQIQWNDAKPEMTSLSFWQNYLGLSGKSE